MAGSARWAGNLNGAACIGRSSDRRLTAADIYHKPGPKEWQAVRSGVADPKFASRLELRTE
jgi:hypothetical protein